MLLEFGVENWLSFYEKTSISLLATKERQHSDHLSRVKKYQLRVLPVASLYGGNASGKSNFFKSLHFARNLIVKGMQPDEKFNRDTFLLDPDSGQKPSGFSFTLLINDTIYEYSFAFDDVQIINESLIEITSSSEKTLFHRNYAEFYGDSSLIKKPSRENYLEFIFDSTRDNQLFLTNAVNLKLEKVKPLYDWFRYNLIFIAPDSRFGGFDKYITDESINFERIFSDLDTGISKISLDPISTEKLSLPKEFLLELDSNISDNTEVFILDHISNDRIIASKENDELLFKRIVTYHRDMNDHNIKFEMTNESDGSIRLFDLIPAFLEASESNSNTVYVIDELDRSLHSLLTKKLLHFFLDSRTPESRSQIIFTTHDLTLMDQKIFRRDEMFIFERSKRGDTSIIPLSDYKDIRFDKNIRKNYLLGRMGGIPNLRLDDNLN